MTEETSTPQWEPTEEDPAGYALYFGAGLVWLAAVIAVVTALATHAPRPALALMVAGATIFVAGHAPPTGPVGMALFGAGVVWLELRPTPLVLPALPATQPSPPAPATRAP